MDGWMLWCWGNGPWLAIGDGGMGPHLTMAARNDTVKALVNGCSRPTKLEASFYSNIASDGSLLIRMWSPYRSLLFRLIFFPCDRRWWSFFISGVYIQQALHTTDRLDVGKSEVVASSV